MKILAYEVREDEKEVLKACADSFGVELLLSDQVPKMENADMTAGCEGVTFLGQGTINAELLGKWKDSGVKYISTRTVGYNHIDIQCAKELGIQVCNASYAPNGVADFTVMLLLMCLRHYKQALWRGQVNDFALGGLLGREVRELTIGIVGTGRIGLQVMKNLSGFGAKLLCCDVVENEAAKTLGTYVDFDTLIRESDVITLHMPLLDSTYHMIDDDAIARMKDGVVLINCARGELMDIGALIRGIESEKIGALGMDTVEGEEGICHGDHRVDILANQRWFYLRQFRNVVMTQHMAFYTESAVKSMAQCGIAGICQMAAGEKCLTKLV